MGYYIPFLDRVESSVIDTTHGITDKAMVLEREKMEGRVIMEIATDDESRVIMGMDLLESILRRAQYTGDWKYCELTDTPQYGNIRRMQCKKDFVIMKETTVSYVSRENIWNFRN